MAELVPNCSHVLHFSDEEVEYLQKIVTKKHKDLYEMFFKTIDSALTEKYPPHNLNIGTTDIYINPKSIFSLIETRLWTHLTDFTVFSSYSFCYAYLLLVIMYEKLEFPPYDTLSTKYYYLITWCLHAILSIHRFFFEINNTAFNTFNIQKVRPSHAEANSIFVPIKKEEHFQASSNVSNFQTCIIL